MTFGTGREKRRRGLASRRASLEPSEEDREAGEGLTDSRISRTPLDESSGEDDVGLGEERKEEVSSSRVEENSKLERGRAHHLRIQVNHATLVVPWSTKSSSVSWRKEPPREGTFNL